MPARKTNALKVPGANLYHEVRGAGPVLLLICGGVYDAAGYAPLAQELADRYTVVTYDRRGNSRSPLDGPPGPQSIEVHGDDAHRVLSAVGVTADRSASVFGNSSGGTIGLDLATRHPEQVRTLVIHEGADREGRMPGGGEAPQGEPDPETIAVMARIQKNFEFFIGYEVPPFNRYLPDVAVLRASTVRVVAAVGEASEGEPPYRAAFAVAERLGTRPEVFPGDHGGFGNQPEAFAAKLHEVLSR